MLESKGGTIATRILVVLFVIAVPLFLVTNSVTWAVNEQRLYHYGFDKYDISKMTGIEDEGLVAAAREIRAYFNSTSEPIDIRAEIYGEERALFNQREVLHMRDVKHLIWGVYVVDLVTAVYILGFVGVGFFIYRRPFTAKLMGYLVWGGSLTLAFVVAVGLAALVGFDSLFLLFHQLSFSNDFWKLDPSRDYLVMMFPQGFWFDATLFVALVTVGQAAVLSGIAGSYLALQRRHLRRKPSSTSQDVLPMQPPSEAAEV